MLRVEPAFLAPLVLLLLASSCGPASPDCRTEGDCVGGTACSADDQCESGACREGTCLDHCEDSSACAPGEGCVAWRGRRCRPDCDPGAIVDAAARGLVCESGVVRSCADLDDPAAYCDVCGCAAGQTCSASRCSDTLTCFCQMNLPVGAPCGEDVECASDHCSTFAGVCRVPRGAACTEYDCDYCHTYADGSSYCSGDCLGDGWCGDDGLCVGSARTNQFVCAPACSGSTDPSCGGTCRPVETESGPGHYCDCAGGGCEIREVAHAPLAPCAERVPTVCASGACIGGRGCDGADCLTTGYCSDPCASDADCGDQGVCVDLSCTGVDPAECGLRCLPRCEEGDRCPGFNGSCLRLYGVDDRVWACRG